MKFKIPDSITTLGEAIRWARERREMTLRKLARVVGVSAPFLSDVEHGRRKPSDLVAIADAVGVDAADLLRLRMTLDAEEWKRAHPEMAKLLDELKTKRDRCWCPWCRCSADRARGGR